MSKAPIYIKTHFNINEYFLPVSWVLVVRAADTYIYIINLEIEQQKQYLRVQGEHLIQK